MCRRRDGDGDCLDSGQEVIQLEERGRAQLGGDSFRAGGIHITYAYEVDFIELGQMPGMMLTQCANSDDADREA
jgi:hypothetical protein